MEKASTNGPPRLSIRLYTGNGVQQRPPILLKNLRGGNKGSFYNFRNCLLGNAAFLAIIGMKPLGKSLVTLARIARDTASRDVFPVHYSRVIDDMFPCRFRFSRPRRTKLNTTINAIFIAVDDFSFKPVRNIPIIHFSLSSRCLRVSFINQIASTIALKVALGRMAWVVLAISG